MRKGLFVLTAIGAILAARLTAGQQSLPSTPLFRAGVNLTTVDVVVRDDKTGQPVTGLTKDDFAIEDDGERQPIASFASVDLPATRAASAAPRPDANRIATNQRPQGRVILFFVDDLTLRFGATPYLRDLLHRFVDGHMTPDDQVAIWTTSDAVPRQAFTTSRARLDAVIDRLQGDLDLVNLPQMGWDDPLAFQSWDDLGMLVSTLAPFSNQRKVIVYLGAWSMAIPPENDAAYEQLLGEAAAANVAIYPISVMGVVGHISLPLNILADETGGAVATRNNFDHVFDHLESDAGTYYLLGFTPNTRDRRPDRLHKLRITVDRPGATVQARTHYVPYSSAFQLSPAATPADALADAPLPERQLPLRMEASCFLDEHGQHTVLVTVHADVPGRRFAGHTLQYSVVANDDRVRPEDESSGASLIPPASTTAAVTIVSALHVGPGMSTIRAALRSDDGLAGSVFLDVDVPNLRGPLVMSDVELSSPANHQLVVGKPPAFITRNLPNPPTVERTFAAADTLTVYGEVYGTDGAGDVSAELTVLDSGRAVERRIPLQLAPATGERGAPLRYLSPVALRGLAPGAHTLDISVTDRDGHAARRRIAIRIANPRHDATVTP